MQDLNSITTQIAQMSVITFKMLDLTHKAFLEHDTDLISSALEEEKKINDLEKEIRTALIELGRSYARKEDRAKTIIYADVVGDLELIGDYCKDILERVQIKIDEKLLFSEDSVKEYEELYHKTEQALKEVTTALEAGDTRLIKAVLKHEEHIDTLVDEYRRHHNQRLIDGVCNPLECNMFLNMLDFTAAIYYHTKKIARNLLKIKK